MISNSFSAKSGLLDSNQRPRAPQTCALPTALNPVVSWCKGNDNNRNHQILYTFFDAIKTNTQFTRCKIRAFGPIFVYLQ